MAIIAQARVVTSLALVLPLAITARAEVVASLAWVPPLVVGVMADPSKANVAVVVA